MISASALKHLKQELGAANVLHEHEDLLVYGYDATPAVQHLPEVVVFPTSAQGVPAALKIAEEEGWAVVPRGPGARR